MMKIKFLLLLPISIFLVSCSPSKEVTVDGGVLHANGSSLVITYYNKSNASLHSFFKWGQKYPPETKIEIEKGGVLFLNKESVNSSTAIINPPIMVFGENESLSFEISFDDFYKAFSDEKNSDDFFSFKVVSVIDGVEFSTNSCRIFNMKSNDKRKIKCGTENSSDFRNTGIIPQLHAG